jgi:DNA-binding Lrp family transcriptional regulator
VGRPQKEVDHMALLDMVGRGLSQDDMADSFGITIPTLQKRIGELQKASGVVIKYRALQSIQLTALQARILEAITPEKIASASLDELARAFKIFKDKELVLEGKPNEIKGALVAHLEHLEKRGFAVKEALSEEEESVDVSFTDITPPEEPSFDPSDPDAIPNI